MKEVKRIMELVEWFEEYQPNDLKQIERIMLGLKYVDSKVVESELRQDIYRKIKLTKSDDNLKCSYKFVDMFFKLDANERIKNK